MKKLFGILTLIWNNLRTLFVSTAAEQSDEDTSPQSLPEENMKPASASVGDVIPPNPQNPQETTKTSETGVIMAEEGKENVSANLPPQTPDKNDILETKTQITDKSIIKRNELIKALIVLGNRQNKWDLKIIYVHSHLESSIWDEKTKTMYPFANPLVLGGNNFWGIKKSSIWDKFIKNPLDNQYYCRFDDVPEAVEFYDKFINYAYPDAYKNRDDKKLFVEWLLRGKFGAFSEFVKDKKIIPNYNYVNDFLARYTQLQNWEIIEKFLTK